MKPENCIVRVESLDGQPQGTGFVVSPALAVTCAHVVEAGGAKPGGRVHLTFQAEGVPIEAEVIADGWHPDKDVAFLRLLAPSPKNATPAVLAASADLEYARVRAFGYPKVGNFQGMWGIGEVAGRVTEGGLTLLQLRSSEITAGFSGGPVWDIVTGTVVGMVTQIATPDQYGRLGEIAFAIPTEILYDLRPNEVTLQTLSPAEAFARPGSAPPLPSLIVGREGDLANLKARLGIGKTDLASASLQVLTALRGWPGVGKTTIAAALVHDSDVAVAFPDGVLWVSLGQQPNLFSELAAWGRALGSDDLLRAHALEESAAQLRALLRHKRMLLIIDDVWKPEHAAPFNAGGRGCATLVTTRINAVAQALAPTANDICRLPVLTDDKALELLQALAPTVVAEYPDMSLELVRELEGLPLALQVAGHLLNVEASYGFGADDLLDELREGARLLEAKAPADRAELANETTPTVAVLLQKSTDHLDDFTRYCFVHLGPFAPKPATFDLAAMKAVWLVDDPKPTTCTLVDRGLLEPVGGGRFQMHALLVMHAKSLLMEEQVAYERIVAYYKQLVAPPSKTGILYWDGLLNYASAGNLEQEWRNLVRITHWVLEQFHYNDALALFVPIVHFLHIWGLWDERLQLSREVCDAAHQLEKPVETWLWIDAIGYILRQRQKKGECLAALERGRELARRFDLEDVLLLADVHEAGLYIETNDLVRAQAKINSVLERVELESILEHGTSMSRIVATRLAGAAALLSERKDLRDKTGWYYECELKLRESTGQNTVPLLLSLAHVSLEADDLASALERLDRAKVLAQKNGLLKELPRIEHGQAVMAMKKGELSEA